MMSCINYLQGDLKVEVASLIHDGVLIEKKYTRKIDIATLTEHVKHTTWLECSFAIKDMAPEAQDLEWATDVREAYREHNAEKEALKASRCDFTNTLVEATVCIPGHSVLAKLFYMTFPDRFVYLGKGKERGWFYFLAPCWRHNKNNNEIIVKFINTKFKNRLVEAISELQKEETPDESLIEAVEFIMNKQLTISTFKDGMIKELQSLYMADDVDEWLNNLDSFDHILGF